MPRTRADVARDDKVDEIVEAARTRLVGGGSGALSVADVARELGLAQNAIYWYFPTKDHLFVAAVERVLHDILLRKPYEGPVVERVLWFAERMHEMQDLRLAMRERARSSEVVATFERNVNDLIRVMLVNALGRDDQTADALMAFCEGVLLRDLSRPERARLIRFGYERLVTPA